MKLKVSQPKLEKLNEKYEIKIFGFRQTEEEHPVADSKISAGFPAYAENFKTDPISIDQFLIKKSESSFIIQVTGESMLDAGIFPNAYIVVDTSVEPKNNSIVVVRVEDEFLVKRLCTHEKFAVLKAENINENYPDIRIDESVDFEIWGTVTGTFQKL
ncbi:MAG: S24 family peptidase [Bacteroidota bacterium]|nr:S24 family peptidase [Bacteroidota bacterium]